MPREPLQGNFDHLNHETNSSAAEESKTRHNHSDIAQRGFIIDSSRYQRKQVNKILLSPII